MIKTRLKKFTKVLWKNIKRPEMQTLPGQLAFFFFLTLVPLVALMGLVCTGLNISPEFINNVMSDYFPQAVTSLILSISDSTVQTNTIVFLVSSLVLASNGTHSMIVASNTIYKMESKEYVYRRVKSFFMLIVLVVLLIFLILIPTFGDMVFDFIINITPENKVKIIVVYLYNFMKIPLSFFFIFLSIKLLYTMAPDSKIPSKYVNYGAIFSSIMWIIITQIYSSYLSLFPMVNTFYGGISNIIVLLWWIYFLAYVFVLGMALNVSNYSIREE